MQTLLLAMSANAVTQYIQLHHTIVAPTAPTQGDVPYICSLHTPLCHNMSYILSFAACVACATGNM